MNLFTKSWINLHNRFFCLCRIFVYCRRRFQSRTVSRWMGKAVRITVERSRTLTEHIPPIRVLTRKLPYPKRIFGSLDRFPCSFTATPHTGLVLSASSSVRWLVLYVILHITYDIRIRIFVCMYELRVHVRSTEYVYYLLLFKFSHVQSTIPNKLTSSQ